MPTVPSTQRDGPNCLRSKPLSSKAAALGQEHLLSTSIFSKQEHCCYFDHLRSTRVSSIVAEGSGRTDSNVPLTTKDGVALRIYELDSIQSLSELPWTAAYEYIDGTVE